MQDASIGEEGLVEEHDDHVGAFGEDLTLERRRPPASRPRLYGIAEITLASPGQRVGVLPRGM